MTLSEYLAAGKRGALTRLHTAISKQPGTPVAYSTLHALASGRTTPRPGTARRIEKATGGKVKAAELLGVAKSRGA